MILAPEDCGCSLGDDGPSVVDSPICSGMILFMVLLESFVKGRCNIATPCQRLLSVGDPESEYDFIVVGAGTAGSIVAGRLAENEDFDVLLLEAGVQEPIGARIPSFYRAFWSNPKVDWEYRTVPADYCLDQGDQGCYYPRGKALGGTSVLNGMMYHRGHAADYEDWVNAGADGWSWEENQPYFQMSEGNKQIGSLVSEKHHSESGRMPIQQFQYQPSFTYEIMNAVNETGLPIITDMNDPDTPEGFCIAQTFSDIGQRFTTARAYLRPRSNLDLKLQSHVSRVLFNGKRAVGVEYIDENGDKTTVRARKEVILSAGALNSPQILLLSGVGPGSTLEKFNIPQVADLPVGQNFKNHYGIALYFILKNVEDIEVLDWSVLVDYLLTRSGPMSGTGITQLTGLLYSSLGDRSRNQPDLQFFFNGFYAECSKTGRIDEPARSCPQDGMNISTNAAILLPRSVGYVTLNSTDPRDPPIMNPQYFSHSDDIIMIKDGMRYLKQIFDSDTLKNKYGVVLDPATTSHCDDSGDEWSDEWMDCMMRYHTDPQNHQIGTASMGQVVNPRLQVYGIEGLRVIDASAIPTQPTGNPQGAIMLVAERGAAFIKDDWENN